MFFRFFNTLNSFESYNKKIFFKKLDIIIILYCDNILVYTNNSN